MLNRSQIDNVKTAELSDAKFATSQAAKEVTIAGFTPSAVIALIALLVSALSLKNSKTTSRQSRFDSESGDELLTELRKLEKSVRKFRGFEIGNSRPLDDRKYEVLEIQAEIEDQLLNITDICDDIGTSWPKFCSGWHTTVRTKAKECLDALEASTCDDIDSNQKFSDSISSISRILKIFIEFVRQKVRETRRQM